MQTIDEAKAHCRFVDVGIGKIVVDGDGLGFASMAEWTAV